MSPLQDMKDKERRQHLASSSASLFCDRGKNEKEIEPNTEDI